MYAREPFMPFYRWCGPALCLFALTVVTGASTLRAADADNGFATVIRPAFAGEELRGQSDLWALDVALKPMRMVFVPITNPRTGAKSSEVVWYLVYKIVHRPLAQKADAADSAPVNVEDPPPPPTFAPKATLVTEDRDGHKAIVDSVIPEALQEILTREELPLKSSVQIAGPLPKLTPADSKKDNAEYGVFMFRGVNPRTTAFSVYLSGFSNAYKVGKDDAGKDLVLRRTIAVPYRRLADEYDQFEKEIRQSGQPKWIYVPDEAPAAAK
jgi:hypothetical protein